MQVQEPPLWPLSCGGTVSVETPTSRPLAVLGGVAAPLLLDACSETRLRQLHTLTAAVRKRTGCLHSALLPENGAAGGCHDPSIKAFQEISTELMYLCCIY